MAGEGNSSVAYTSGADYHINTLGDYNDMVAVPKHVLVDTADALRLKTYRSTQITVEDGTGDISRGIMPIDFADTINNLFAVPFNKLKFSLSSVPTTGGATKKYNDCYFEAGSSGFSLERILFMIFIPGQEGGPLFSSTGASIGVYTKDIGDHLINDIQGQLSYSKFPIRSTIGYRPNDTLTGWTSNSGASPTSNQYKFSMLLSNMFDYDSTTGKYSYKTVAGNAKWYPTLYKGDLNTATAATLDSNQGSNQTCRILLAYQS